MQNTTTKMIIPDTDSEESDDSEDEEEEEYQEEEDESEVDECYMIVTKPAQDSDEEMDEDPDSFSAKFKEMIKYDKILTIVTKKKYQEKEEPKSKEEEDEEEDEDDQDDYMEVQGEDDQNNDSDDDGPSPSQRSDENQDQDQDQAGQAEDQDKRSSPASQDSSNPSDLEDDEQPEEKDIIVVLLVKKTDEEQESQKQEKQEKPSTNQKMSRPFPDTREFVVFGDHPDETACELSKKSFKSSICKILPDTAEFPEDIFNIEGCIWCGSKGHDVYNCLGYATWLGDMWLGTVEERRVTYPQRQEHIKRMLKAAKVENHNPEKPWELYTGLDDGEYLSERGVKILIKNSRIVNLIPRHLQTTTTIYSDLPTAQEMGRMMHLSTNIQPAAQTTVMEELCNQAVAVKEDMIELEVELKRCFSRQMMDLKAELRKELCAITTMVEEKVSSLPHQLVSFREYLSKSLANLHQRSLQSDITLVEAYRSLSEAKNADSCLTWRSTLCQNDPSYHMRSRWRQLSDRLNFITEYTLRNNLVVPTTGRKYAEELKEISTLIGEVMYQMFYRAGILEKDDLVDIEDFWSFQETVCRTLAMQAISPNQVCNFIQQILYYDQCEKKKFTTYMDCQRQVEASIGILLQTTLKVWDKPGNCKCNFEDKLNCRHSYKYAILKQHFPSFGLTKTDDLIQLLDSINNQTCDCCNHAALPMHGPSKYIKASIPAYHTLQELHLKTVPELKQHQPNLHDLYVRGVMSWIYSRLFQYLTPYSDQCMNREPGPVRCSVQEFYPAENQFLENRLSILHSDDPLQTIWEKVLQLGDLKKTHCQCQVHREDRETNLLYQLKLHNTCGNRDLVSKILRSKPLGFSALISSCKQIIGTANQCQLLQYEVKPTTAGTFEATEVNSKQQPHNQMKADYSDISGDFLIHVCKDHKEEHSIGTLLDQFKGEPEVEIAADGIEDFLDSGMESEASSSTSSSGIPDLVDSFHSCHIF